VGTFLVRTVRRDESLQATVIVPYADITIKWISGGGSPLAGTTGRTNSSGVASMLTPENYLQVGLPTGANGQIEATKGTLRGSALAGVNIWGQANDVVIDMGSDTSGLVNETIGKITSGAKTSVIAIVAVAVAVGLLFFAIGRVLKPRL